MGPRAGRVWSIMEPDAREEAVAGALTRPSAASEE